MVDETSALPQWRARIHVTLKPVVLDPQGEAVLTGLRHLGFSTVGAVRIGKYLEVTLGAAEYEAAAVAVREMCERLLANPVIESYHFDLESRESPTRS
ncbi:MAG: phosphoribosylformylglycinamidine synthase subunit PurS [Ktedonobacterales bacterium]|nr:phosphoribosylformylglycinamidine synthase subunit PurS [Ktedonobacterales bacterium]